MNGPKPIKTGSSSTRGSSSTKQNGSRLPPPMFRFMPLAKNALESFESSSKSTDSNSTSKDNSPSSRLSGSISTQSSPSTGSTTFSHYPVKRIPPPLKKPKLMGSNKDEKKSITDELLSAHPSSQQLGNEKKAFTTKYDLPPNNIPSTSSASNLPMQISDTPRSALTESPSPPTEIELPPNCNLFRIVHKHQGVNREFMIPMTAGSTIADVLNNLPISFDDIAATVSEAEKNNYANHDKSLSMSFEDDSKNDDTADEAPYLVNPKQYHRIVKRREMRERLTAAGRIPSQRQKYLHESRHRHAVQRVRGEDGRFDRKLQTEALKTTENSPNQPDPIPLQKETKFTHYVNIRPAAEASSSFTQIPVHHVQPINSHTSEFKLQNL